MRSKRPLSESVERQLVAMLFDQTPTLIAGGIALALAAVMCWQWTGQSWFAWWAVLMLVTLAARVGIDRAFHHRPPGNDDAAPWRRRFVAGAWVMGALWGLGARTIVDHDNPRIQMIVLMVETVIIMGAAARNASCPLATNGQSLLGLAPLVGACIVTRDPYYSTCAAFFVFAFFAALKLSSYLYDRHVRFLLVAEELEAVNERLELAATTDSLTGVANRRRFDIALADEVRRAQRDDSQLALLFLDIDVFKGFNDLYGHQAGDACLQRVAATLAEAFRRPGDLVARYGGEEFAIILPRTDTASAVALAETVRGAIEALALESAASPVGVISVSIGVAAFVPGRFRRPEDFIRSADEALYAAKGAGRNRVRTARGIAISSEPFAGRRASRPAEAMPSS